jgi:hypothetical protein
MNKGKSRLCYNSPNFVGMRPLEAIRVSVSEVLEAVRAMSPGARARVRALLDALLEGSSSTDDAAQARLHEAGLLSGTQPLAARARRTPVAIKGKPLSETIIKERL